MSLLTPSTVPLVWNWGPLGFLGGCTWNARNLLRGYLGPRRHLIEELQEYSLDRRSDLVGIYAFKRVFGRSAPHLPILPYLVPPLQQPRRSHP